MEHKKKSKVLVVGKRIGKSNKWVHKDTYIEDKMITNTLGIFLSFS
jgi:hypothetical protein